MYHCRSDTESLNTPDDMTMSTTFLLDNSTTLAVMYGCTPEVMEGTVAWLKLLKGPSFHPLILPMIFAEFERGRLLEVFSLQNSEVHQKILAMENKLKEDERITDVISGVEVIQKITQRDCDSTKLWLSISRLKNGLESLKTQLESMIRHSKVLSDSIFTEADGGHEHQRASGIRIVARLEEMIAEIEGRVRTCDGLLGGMTLSMQMVSGSIHYMMGRFVDMATLMIFITRSRTIIRDEMQIPTPTSQDRTLTSREKQRETATICRQCLSWV